MARAASRSATVGTGAVITSCSGASRPDRGTHPGGRGRRPDLPFSVAHCQRAGRVFISDIISNETRALRFLEFKAAPLSGQHPSRPPNVLLHIEAIGAGRRGTR